VDDELRLSGIASLESSTQSNRENLQKNQSKIVRGTISHIHKVKEKNALISPSMCFSATTVLLLIVEAFIMFFDNFFLILFMQREVNCKCDNTDNSENVTKVYQ
jgi:hypothetical protein